MHGVSIIGTGRLGGALALALHEKGVRIESLAARDIEPKKAIFASIIPSPEFLDGENIAEVRGDVVLIATEDTEIGEVACILAANCERTIPFVLHTSGSRSSELLAPLREKGSAIGSIHPLVSVSEPVSGAGSFEGAYFCIEGDDDAVRKGKEIAALLNARPFSIDTEMKPLYHASAVLSSGHLVALVDTAVDSLSLCGIEREQAKEVLLPLVSSTLSNLGEKHLHEALTGTFSRADQETFRAHLKVLREFADEDALALYLLLGRRSVRLAREQGADAEALDCIEREISEALSAIRK